MKKKQKLKLEDLEKESAVKNVTTEKFVGGMIILQGLVIMPQKLWWEID